MSKKIKVGIIGIGGMGKVHTACYMNNKNVEVIACCARNKKELERFQEGDWDDVVYANEKLGEFNSLYRIERAYVDWEELLSDKDIDAVSITTPNSLHYSQTIKALKYNKHVLVEKPIATSAKEVEQMIKVAKEVNKQLMGAQCWRFHPEVNYVKELVKKNLLGKIVKVKGYGIHVLWYPPGWFIDKELAGGGALLDMGVHGIDTIRYILGDISAKSVYAKLKTCFGDYEVDDMGVLMIEFENDITAIVESGWNLPYSEGGEATTIIIGNKGYARIFPCEGALNIADKFTQFKPQLYKEYGFEELYQAEIDHFIDCIIKNKKSSIIDAERILPSMKIIDAAYTSMKNNKVIML